MVEKTGMALRKQLRVKILGNGQEIEAIVTLSGDDKVGWRAFVVTQWLGEKLIHETELVENEREVLQAAAVWMRSHFTSSGRSLATVCAITA